MSEVHADHIKPQSKGTNAEEQSAIALLSLHLIKSHCHTKQLSLRTSASAQPSYTKG